MRQVSKPKGWTLKSHDGLCHDRQDPSCEAYLTSNIQHMRLGREHIKMLMCWALLSLAMDADEDQDGSGSTVSNFEPLRISHQNAV